MKNNCPFSIKALILLVGVLTLLPLISAQLIYKFNSNIDLKIPCINNGTYCSSSSFCNITIMYPGGNIAVDNKKMTNKMTYHNYTMDATSINELGLYQAAMFCNDGGRLGTSVFDFEVTGNGKEKPSGIVIIIFIIIYISIIGLLIYILLYSLGHFTTLDFDILDLAFNISLYFILLMFYMFSKDYLGNPSMESFLGIIIDVGAITNVLVPIIAFIISITAGSIYRKKFNIGRLPQRPRWQRNMGY